MTRVAICGAGPVGMALALLLAKRDVPGGDIALLDARTVEQSVSDPRSVALSWGSRQLLEDIGVWPVPATAIHEIHVSRAGQFGRSLMERSEHDVEALGYVARYGDVVDALSRACVRAGIEVMRPARVAGIDETADGVMVRLEDGRTVTAAVAVQAEGGTFGAQGDKAARRDYGQTAVIARVSSSRPVPHRAFERFTDQGPLALLPQAGADGHQYALVWCVQPERATELLALDDAAFLAALGAAFGERVGTFTAASKRTSYPLGLTIDARSTARTVAIGNAAQTLHPVAGQGLNLGLRDAAVLARLLAQGDSLTAFETARSGDRSLTVGLTDTMARVFAGSGPLQSLLGLSLGALDAVGPARKALASVMMFGRR
ncbi:MAG: FAD-dependent monooxygenase [Pseudomonadota bacterium]|nr:FAD-dependent monooxygenase [Pseudomonadota bacterium]